MLLITKKKNSINKDRQLKLAETCDININKKKEENEIEKNKDKEKDIYEKKEAQDEQNNKEEKILELGTKSDKKIDKNILIDELEQENIIKHMNTQNNENINLREFIKPLIPKGIENNKNNLVKANIINSKKKLKINSSKKNKDKNITLITNQNNLNNVRRKLIKK